MNVIVSNLKKDELNSLDIDVIKSINGQYDIDELISIFKGFFYEKMILDVTAIKNYKDVETIVTLATTLGKEKTIILLTDDLCTSNYLGYLIDNGVYNFTNNINAIKRLILKSNTFDDVSKLKVINKVSKELEENSKKSSYENNIRILGIENVTEHAGSTTLTYMFLKTLKKYFGIGIYAIELEKNDFRYFNDKNMFSIKKSELNDKIRSLNDAKVIIIDINKEEYESVCDDIIYLIEPSIIKLNKLISLNPRVFQKLNGKKIILNKSILSNKDVTEFEYEANIKVFYNLPSLDERSDNNILEDLISRLGLFDETGARKADGNKIFGIFKH